MTHTTKESLRWLGIAIAFMNIKKIQEITNQTGFIYTFPKESGYKEAYTKKKHWKVIWRE